MIKMKAEKERKVVAGCLFGMIIGGIVDVLISIATVPSTCTLTPLQQFIGLECLKMGKMYGFLIWFGIIGGFVGYFTANKKSPKQEDDK